MSDKAVIRLAEMILTDVKAYNDAQGIVWQALKSLEHTADELSDRVSQLDEVIRDHGIVKWERTRDVARRTRYHEQTIRDWARRGMIPSYRSDVDSDYRFDAAEVDAALKTISTRGRTDQGADHTDQSIGCNS